MTDVLDQTRQQIGVDLIEVLKQAELNAAPTAQAWLELLGRTAAAGPAPATDRTAVADLIPVIGAATESMNIEQTRTVRMDEIRGRSCAVSGGDLAADRHAAGVSVDEFLEWLEGQDFGEDPTRLRREAWGE